jgi:hypothetical protein
MGNSAYVPGLVLTVKDVDFMLMDAQYHHVAGLAKFDGTNMDGLYDSHHTAPETRRMSQSSLCCNRLTREQMVCHLWRGTIPFDMY